MLFLTLMLKFIYCVLYFLLDLINFPIKLFLVVLYKINFFTIEFDKYRLHFLFINEVLGLSFMIFS